MSVSTISRAPWYRLRLNGTQAEMAADAVQNQALEGVITTVATIELESTVTLATNVSADIYQVEQIAATIAPQFAGIVNHVSGQSWPNRVVLTCVGPLARLRRCPAADQDLTGMTEGAAAQYVLTACGITYDSGDIADSGYTLGAQTPVLWIKDQPGHEMLAELDRVFGMATIEAGAGRIVRFPYDRVPDPAAIGVTYTRGVDAVFWGNQRDKGDLDAIVNLVQVRGASWQSSSCTLTPWGRGSANNADLGGTARNRSMSFQSDLIQDEALATAVATRLMRWWNRQPDDLTLVAVNDIDVNPGAVIGVKDAAYGIGLSADATATPYLVLTVDRRGDEMTLNCVGGAAGATGTVAHGVEKVCNQTSSNVPIVGSFTPPSIGYPPSFLPYAPYACLSDGGPDGICPDSGGGGGSDGCLTPGDWTVANGTASTGTPGAVTFGDMSNDPEVHLIDAHIPINAPALVTISGHVSFSGSGTAGVDEPIISIGLQEQSSPFNFAGLQADWDPGAGVGYFYLYGFGPGFNQTDVTASLLYSGFDFTVTLDSAADRVSFTAAGESASVALGTWTNADLVLVGASATGIEAAFTDLEVCFNARGDGDLLGARIESWITTDGTLGTGTGNLVADDHGAGYSQAYDVDPARDWTLTATATMSVDATHAHDVEIGIAHWNGSAFNSQFAVDLLSTVDAGGIFYVYSPGDSTWLDGTPFSDGVDLSVTLAWDASTMTLSVSVDDGSRTETATLTDATAPTSPLHVYIHVSGSTGGGSGLDVSAMNLAVG